MKEKEIRVVIADAQYLIRFALRQLLYKQADIRIIGEAANSQQLFALLEEEHPDILVIDYNQDPHFSLETLAKARQVSPQTRILVISADANKETIYQVLESGIKSFLTKNCDEGEIIDAIAATAKGEKFFCTRVIDFLLEKSFARIDDSCAPTPLTSREIEIVQLTAQGLVAKEIAHRLNLSPHTVYTHRKNIMEKLRIKRASELVLYAVNNGLVTQ
ncbi:MAG: response regulator transcription factor [Lewinellaceae bacterium]|nr:response regulator transcription factor [Lewinellaceae bacterium]